MITTTLNIDIWDVEVDNFYYEFKYRINVNGKTIIEEETYSNDHGWNDDPKGFEKMLKESGAAKIVFEECIPDNYMEI